MWIFVFFEGLAAVGFYLSRCSGLDFAESGGVGGVWWVLVVLMVLLFIFSFYLCACVGVVALLTCLCFVVLVVVLECWHSVMGLCGVWFDAAWGLYFSLLWFNDL